MIDLGINLFQEIAALGGGGGGYSISNSLRFNDDDSAYLSRTPASAGNRKTWTWSGWVKRGSALGSNQALMYVTSPNNSAFRFEQPNGILRLFFNGATDANLETSAIFRDVSGWYHFVIAVDTTQATASDRIKIYVNGLQITSFSSSSYPSQNYESGINSNVVHNLGGSPAGGEYFDGYMAEINFIDGQALTADDFGQIDATTGEWSPKKYSGTYGTNGFYLPFNGNANDDSGNGNNWTENNLASTDYMIDTPTNNFEVFSPIDPNTIAVLSEGNLKAVTAGTAGVYAAYGTVGVSSGKWYMECTLNGFSYSGNGQAGLFGLNPTYDRAQLVGAFFSTGSSFWNARAEGASSVLSFSGSAVGMVMQIAIDLDAGKLWVGKDGVWNGSGDPDTGANPDRTFTPSGTYKGFIEPYADGVGYWRMTANYGQDSSFAGVKTRQGNTDANGIGDFYYTPPTGYLALCTDNLPEPAIVDSESQFNVVTYTGDGNTGRTVTGVGFQPDFVWIKRRDGTDGHIINDSVRGVAKNLFPFSTIAENTTAYLSSFDTDGFTLDIMANATNLSGASYVAWCWKAGGTAVSNTDGSITSQVSANVDAGFSIVSYTGNSTIGATVGHGLSAEPDMVIFKNRDTNIGWFVYHSAYPTSGSNAYIFGLNSTNGATLDSRTNRPWGAFTNSILTLGSDVEVNNSNMIAYCFHSVEGFSKFGSYVGNGSADGPFVYTGFKPAFVMVKSADNSIGSWIMYDNARGAFNLNSKKLRADAADSENAAYAGGDTIGVDFLSNGFKHRNNVGANHNTSGEAYLYMAFAEHPFKEALAR